MHSEIMKQGKPLTLFLSYTQEDESLLQELETHMSLLRQQKPSITWNNQRIGSAWAKVNDEWLEQASIVLLLVSPTFMASQDCYNIATRAMQREATDQVPVIPILLHPADLWNAPFELRTLLPSNGKPITEWTDRDAAFDDVVRGILITISDLRRTDNVS